MKKIYFLLISLIIFVFPCTAEIKNRIDKYRDYIVRITWSSNYSSGPDNTNWAKKKWPEGTISGTQYVYIINPKKNEDKGRVIVERLIYGDNYKYSYIVNVYTYYPDENEWETTASYCYYSYEEMDSFNDFFKWQKLFDRYVQWDER